MIAITILAISCSMTAVMSLQQAVQDAAQANATFWGQVARGLDRLVANSSSMIQLQDAIMDYEDAAVDQHITAYTLERQVSSFKKIADPCLLSSELSKGVEDFTAVANQWKSYRLPVRDIDKYQTTPASAPAPIATLPLTSIMPVLSVSAQSALAHCHYYLLEAHTFTLNFGPVGMGYYFISFNLYLLMWMLAGLLMLSLVR